MDWIYKFASNQFEPVDKYYKSHLSQSIRKIHTFLPNGGQVHFDSKNYIVTIKRYVNDGISPSLATLIHNGHAYIVTYNCNTRTVQDNDGAFTTNYLSSENYQIIKIRMQRNPSVDVIHELGIRLKWYAIATHLQITLDGRLLSERYIIHPLIKHWAGKWHLPYFNFKNRTINLTISMSPDDTHIQWCRNKGFKLPNHKQTSLMNLIIMILARRFGVSDSIVKQNISIFLVTQTDISATDIVELESSLTGSAFNAIKDALVVSKYTNKTSAVTTRLTEIHLSHGRINESSNFYDISFLHSVNMSSTAKVLDNKKVQSLLSWANIQVNSPPSHLKGGIILWYNEYNPTSVQTIYKAYTLLEMIINNPLWVSRHIKLNKIPQDGHFIIN